MQIRRVLLIGASIPGVIRKVVWHSLASRKRPSCALPNSKFIPPSRAIPGNREGRDGNECSRGTRCPRDTCRRGKRQPASPALLRDLRRRGCVPVAHSVAALQVVFRQHAVDDRLAHPHRGDSRSGAQREAQHGGCSRRYGAYEPAGPGAGHTYPARVLYSGVRRDGSRGPEALQRARRVDAGPLWWAVHQAGWQDRSAQR